MIRKIHQDTQYFTFENTNPKGYRTTDCVVRAIANVLSQTWEKTYRDLFELGMKYSRPPEDDLIVEKYMKMNNAIKLAQPRKRDNTKFAGTEICYLIQEGKFIDNDGVVLPYDKYLIRIGTGHVSCIISGKIHDTWNCSYDKVGIMWAVPEKEYEK